MPSPCGEPRRLRPPEVEENEIKGIYELKGDTLRICGAGQGGERPKEFKSDEGSDAMLLTFRREKKKTDK